MNNQFFIDFYQDLQSFWERLLKLYYFVHFLKNGITVLYCKFLSRFQQFRKYRCKTFPLRDLTVPDEKFSIIMSVALHIKYLCGYITSPINRTIKIFSRNFCWWFLSLNFLCHGAEPLYVLQSNLKCSNLKI